MTFSRRTAQLLHEDHQETITVIEALDQLIAKSRKKAPDTGDAMVKKAISQAADKLEEEVNRHFDFEETELFTRLEEMGDVGIGVHLREEHRALSPLCHSVAEQARVALQNGFDDATWNEFRTIAAELIERMFAHIQKEEMALVPALEDLLDPETDMELSAAYADSH